MVTNAFINHEAAPKDAELAAALGAAKPAWDRFLQDLAREVAANVLEWKCHSPKHGWALRVKHKARTIVWLAPATGCFEVLFILGEKALKAAQQSKLPRRLVEAIANATKYPEGTGVRLVVRAQRDCAALMRLATIKAST